MRDPMTASYRVIIAHDDPSLRSFLHRVVLQVYLTAIVTCVFNGAAALHAYEEAGADLVIADYRMPVMDGVAMTREVRARDPQIPIIVVSSDPTIAPAAIAAGATAFLEVTAIIHQLRPLLMQLLPP